jgi:hypothetical protein
VVLVGQVRGTVTDSAHLGEFQTQTVKSLQNSLQGGLVGHGAAKNCSGRLLDRGDILEFDQLVRGYLAVHP